MPKSEYPCSDALKTGAVCGETVRFNTLETYHAPEVELLLLVATVLFISGCVVPRAKIKSDEKCELVTREYRLEISDELTGELFDDAADSMFEGCEDIACILVSPFVKLIVVPVGSFVISGVVSGSVVVVGNTIHWIERQGKCDDSSTQKAFDSLVNNSRSLGGKIIHKSADLIDWFKEKVRREKEGHTQAFLMN